MSCNKEADLRRPKRLRESSGALRRRIRRIVLLCSCQSRRSACHSFRVDILADLKCRQLLARSCGRPRDITRGRQRSVNIPQSALRAAYLGKTLFGRSPCVAGQEVQELYMRKSDGDEERKRIRLAATENSNTLVLNSDKKKAPDNSSRAHLSTPRTLGPETRGACAWKTAHRARRTVDDTECGSSRKPPQGVGWFVL